MENSEASQTPDLQSETLNHETEQSPIPDFNNFKTPSNPKESKTKKVSYTPISIPESPFMQKLGCGTGVNVYLINRDSPSRNIYQSPWAVKKLNSRVRQNPEFKSRLEDEAKILKTLNHPNIIGFRSEGRSADGNVCLLMESGEKSLRDKIDERLEQDLGPFPPEIILKVAQSLCSALHYLHEEAHILHGDLKSGNVLIKENFSVIKLCDFGVTLKLNDELTVEEDSCYIGSECWSAPEVFKCGKITNKTDMFSFGLILWEMMTLNLPHIDKLDLDSSKLEGLSTDESEELELAAEKEFQGALGTRPDFSNVTLGPNYENVLKIFNDCTNEEPSSRPSAKQILESYFENL